MTCSTVRGPVSRPVLPDFSDFGLEPLVAGRLIAVSVDGGVEGSLKGSVLQYPNGRIGSLAISENSIIHPWERDQVALLGHRCRDGDWTLAGLRDAAPRGSFARMLVEDALAAERAG